MSTTRSLQQALSKSKKLKTVKTGKSLGIATPCDNIAAHIRNETVNTLQTNDVSQVAYRQLQNKRGEENALHDIAMFSFMFTLAVGYIAYDTYNQMQTGKIFNEKDPYKYLMFAISMFATLGHLLPAINIRPIYKESKEACKEWLRQRVDKDLFNKIQNLPINKNSKFYLFQLLQEYKIPITDKHFAGYERIKKLV